MKKILSIFFTILLIFSLFACGSEQTGQESPAKDNKYADHVLVEVVNLSGSPWILIPGHVPDPDVHSVTFSITTMTVEPGESTTNNITVNGDLKDYEEMGLYQKTSDRDYELDLYIIETPIPTDPEVLEDNFTDEFNLVQVPITGTLGEYAVIEWDGSNFKQVK